MDEVTKGILQDMLALIDYVSEEAIRDNGERYFHRRLIDEITKKLDKVITKE